MLECKRERSSLRALPHIPAPVELATGDPLERVYATALTKAEWRQDLLAANSAVVHLPAVPTPGTACPRRFPSGERQECWDGSGPPRSALSARSAANGPGRRRGTPISPVPDVADGWISPISKPNGSGLRHGVGWVSRRSTLTPAETGDPLLAIPITPAIKHAALDLQQTVLDVAILFDCSKLIGVAELSWCSVFLNARR